MNLATYLTAKPFPVAHGRLVSIGWHDDNDSCPEGLAEHHKMRAAISEAQVMQALTEPNMTVTAICKASGLKDNSVRRILERLAGKCLVTVCAISNNKQLWTKA